MDVLWVFKWDSNQSYVVVADYNISKYNEDLGGLLMRYDTAHKHNMALWYQ